MKTKIKKILLSLCVMTSLALKDRSLLPLFPCETIVGDHLIYQRISNLDGNTHYVQRHMSNIWSDIEVDEYMQYRSNPSVEITVNLHDIKPSDALYHTECFHIQQLWYVKKGTKYRIWDINNASSNKRAIEESEYLQARSIADVISGRPDAQEYADYDLTNVIFENLGRLLDFD